MRDTISFFEFRVSFEEYAGSDSLRVSPFVSRLHKQVSTAGKQLDSRIAISHSLRLVCLILTLAFTSSAVGFIFLSRILSAFQPIFMLFTSFDIFPFCLERLEKNS